MKPQQPDGCEDFIKTSNEADRFFFGFYYNEVSNSLRKRRSFSK